ncbi:MAG: MarR family winged helix-turn-helix transcriptional regulator [Maricaulaceae bacterium]
MNAPSSIESLATQTNGTLNFDPVDFTDTTFQNYAEKIATDYTDIIKAKVLPKLGDIGDIKFRELRVLISIYFFALPITPAHLAEILRYDPATVSRAVRRLEKAGKLSRQDNGKDKRSIQLRLTDEGKALAMHYTNTVQNEFKTLEADLVYGLSPEEKTAFMTVMVKISRRAEMMKTIGNV